jgi:hypothetical protein
MAVIENNALRPDVQAGFHQLKIEAVELVDGTRFGSDEPEQRIKLTLRVLTPDHPPECFVAFMSAKLGEKATLGSIVRAIFGSTPTDRTVDTDLLLNQAFRHMVTINDEGWPRLTSGTAAPASAEAPF